MEGFCVVDDDDDKCALIFHLQDYSHFNKNLKKIVVVNYTVIKSIEKRAS